MREDRAAKALDPLHVARTCYLAVGAAALIVWGVLRVVFEDAGGAVDVVAGAVILVLFPHRLAPAFAFGAVAAEALLQERWPIVGAALLGVAMATIARRANDAAQPVVSEAPEVAADGAALDAVLVIRSLGTLVLRDSEADHAGWLFKRPAHSFLWLYLLARAVTEPGGRVVRASLAAALNPRVDAETQRARLKNRINELSKLMPASMRAVFTQDQDLFWLNLELCDFDVDRLRRLRDRCRAEAPLSDPRLAQIEAEFKALGWGEFLPAWEEVEERQTAALGDAGEDIAGARRIIDGLRADVALVLAEAHLARQQPAAAAELLAPAAERSPEREDVLLRLETAYVKADRQSQALAVRHGNLETGVK